MRKYLIFLVVGLFLALVTGYLVSITNPLEETAQRLLITSQQVTDDSEMIDALLQLKQQGLLIQYLNWRSVIPVLITATGSIFAIFIAAHMALDKLFWKKFYEQPSIPVAIRRGIFLILILGFYIFCQLYAVEIGIFGLGALFVVLIEMIINRITNPGAGSGSGSGEVQQDEEGENESKDKDERLETAEDLLPETESVLP